MMEWKMEETYIDKLQINVLIYKLILKEERIGELTLFLVKCVHKQEIKIFISGYIIGLKK